MIRFASVLALLLPGAPAFAVAVPLPETTSLPSGSDAAFRAAPPRLIAPPERDAPSPMDEMTSFEPRDGLRVSSGYGGRIDPVRGIVATHRGIDLPARIGTPVAAAQAGIVRVAGAFGSYGNLVEIDHGNGVQTRYAHLSRILVRRGDQVTRGERIGLVGSTGRSTGAHLHYEVRIAGMDLDPRTLAADVSLPRTLLATTPTVDERPLWQEAVDRLPVATPRPQRDQPTAAMSFSRSASRSR